MFSSAKNSKHNGALPKNASGPNPQSVKLSRQDFHYFATSLLNPNPNSIFHLEELVKEDINSCFENGTKNGNQRKEIIQEKYDITAEDYTKASETAYLDTIDYFVNGFVPMLTASINETTGDLKNPKDSKGTTKDLKKLLTNLMVFHKESTTETAILNNLYPKKKKLVIETDLVENVSIQPKLTRKQLTPETSISASNCDPDKKPCPYDGCDKIYTTKGALSFHIRAKHQHGDALKKDVTVETLFGKREFPSRNLINKIRPSSSFCLTPQPTRLPAIKFPEISLYDDNSKIEMPKISNIATAPIREVPIVTAPKTVESDSDSNKKSTVGSTIAMTKDATTYEKIEDDLIIKNAFSMSRNKKKFRF
jgi:hypothetical protein